MTFDANGRIVQLDLDEGQAGDPDPTAAVLPIPTPDVPAGFTVLTADIAFDSPGINNPNTGLGFDTGIVIPAGSLFKAFLVAGTDGWDVAGVHVLTASQDGEQGPSVGAWSHAAQAGPGVRAEPNTQTAFSAFNLARWAEATEEQHLYDAFFPDAGDPTMGVATVYALVVPLPS